MFLYFVLQNHFWHSQAWTGNRQGRAAGSGTTSLNRQRIRAAKAAAKAAAEAALAKGSGEVLAFVDAPVGGSSSSSSTSAVPQPLAKGPKTEVFTDRYGDYTVQQWDEYNQALHNRPVWFQISLESLMQ